jgi:hypothetical protein
LPTSLIYVRLSSDYGVDFSDLVGTFGGLVDDSGAMPKGWEKLKLPKNLSTDSAKGSETPSKEGTSSPQVVTTSPQQVPLKPQDSQQQVPPNSQVSPQQATTTPAQASLDGVKAREPLDLRLQRLCNACCRSINDASGSSMDPGSPRALTVGGCHWLALGGARYGQHQVKSFHTSSRVFFVASSLNRLLYSEWSLSGGQRSFKACHRIWSKRAPIACRASWASSAGILMSAR